jgi:hypothetical protein
VEVLLRIQNLLDTRCLYVKLQHLNETLEAKVEERTRELEDAQFEMLERRRGPRNSAMTIPGNTPSESVNWQVSWRKPQDFRKSSVN